MTIGLLLSVEDIYSSDLPTLALVNEMNPVLGLIASIATYLMIFSTSLGIAVTLVGFVLSFMPFTSLVNNVFPWLGWLGIIFILVLVGSWILSGRTDISEESLRRDRVRALLLYKLDPQRRWTPRHANALIQAVDESNLRARHLGDFMHEDVYREALDTSEIDMSSMGEGELGEYLSDLQRTTHEQQMKQKKQMKAERKEVKREEKVVKREERHSRKSTKGSSTE